jgi:hypothetical protein
MFPPATLFSGFILLADKLPIMLGVFRFFLCREAEGDTTCQVKTTHFQNGNLEALEALGGKSYNHF